MAQLCSVIFSKVICYNIKMLETENTARKNHILREVDKLLDVVTE